LKIYIPAPTRPTATKQTDTARLKRIRVADLNKSSFLLFFSFCPLIPNILLLF